MFLSKNQPIKILRLTQTSLVIFGMDLVLGKKYFYTKFFRVGPDGIDLLYRPKSIINNIFPGIYKDSRKYEYLAGRVIIVYINIKNRLH
jgi:hypothetical protein